MALQWDDGHDGTRQGLAGQGENGGMKNCSDQTRNKLGDQDWRWPSMLIQ
jgi:hypothetical protein